MFRRYAQAAQQPLPAADVGATMTSEYNTKYQTKGDQGTVNQIVLHVANVLEDANRNASSVKSGVISRSVNHLHRTCSFPLIMSAYYVLGYGDSWCPMRTIRLDVWAFQRDLQAGHRPVFDQHGNEYTLMAGAVNDTGATKVALLSDVLLYK